MYSVNRLCRSILAVLFMLQSLPVLSQAELTGRFEQGGMVVGKVPAGSKVLLNDKPLRVSDDGYFVFGFDRDAEPGDKLVTESPAGERHEQVLTVSSREYQKQFIEGIPRKMMHPSEEDLKRIRDENWQVAVARKEDFAQDNFRESFAWPAIGPITGVFGSQRVYNGEPRRPHYGLDIAGDVGTLVKAPASGIVTLAHPDMFYSGGTLILDHGHGLSSSFLHLSAILVKVGDEVQQGQAIARIGKTGRVTGAHLDWRMNWFERRIDPQLLVPPMPAGDE